MSREQSTWLGIPGDEQAWTALGFTVEGSAVRIGHVCCAFTGERAWGFDEIHDDPSALRIETLVRPPEPAAVHPCGVTRADHIVYTVEDLDSAVDSLSAVLGAPPRSASDRVEHRDREMAFYRAGEAFIEVVATGRHPELIGLAVRSPDLDGTVAEIRARGGTVSDPKPAVQGGRICTVSSGHIKWGLAIMGP